MVPKVYSLSNYEIQAVTKLYIHALYNGHNCPTQSNYEATNQKHWNSLLEQSTDKTYSVPTEAAKTVNFKFYVILFTTQPNFLGLL